MFKEQFSENYDAFKIRNAFLTFCLDTTTGFRLDMQKINRIDDLAYSARLQKRY